MLFLDLVTCEAVQHFCDFTWRNLFFGAATRTKNPDEDQLLAKTLPASEKVLEVEAVGEANRMMGVTFF